MQEKREVRFLEVLEDTPQIPKDLLSGYTMNNAIPIEVKIRDDSTKQVQEMVKKNFNQKMFQQSKEMIINRQTNYYGPTDTWLYQALSDYPIEDKSVVVIGSTHPWYEIMALVYGAKSVTVIEYGERETFHDKIQYKHPSDIINEKFDVCLNISSIEHDGLGRYGDPLDPDADLKTMKRYKDLLTQDGIMFLSIPVGKDYIYYNVHRIYGEKRFPLLIEGWEPLKYYGFSQNCFETVYNNADATNYQPVVVLRNKK